MTAAPLLLLLAGLAAQDPVKVQAGLSRSEIDVGETTVLRVDVETTGVRAEIDRLTRLPPGIELASTRDYDQRQFSIPGGTRRFITREFVLRGRAAGQFRIPSLEVRADGRTYTTSSQVLTVSAPPPGLGGSSAPGASERGVALNVWLDADTAYVGQQVTMQAEAMFSQSARLRLRRAPEYEAPSPSGFWIDDLPEHRTSTSRVIDGEVFEVQGFRRAFFPLTPGRHVVPPARLEYEMRRGILYAPETFELRSDSLPLVVLPIPEQGRPPEFTGAVGRFTIRSSLQPAEIPAGEAVVLRVDVEGTGNVKAIPPPALPEMPGVEVFPPSEEATTRIEDGVVGGTKTFSWVLIPERAGEVVIPPVRYPHFDPSTRSFRTAEAPALELSVTPGTVAGARTATARPATLRYLKTRPEGEDPLGWVASPWFLLLQLLPLMALAAGWRASRSVGGVSRRELRRRRKAGIRDLERRSRQPDPGLLPDAESFARSWLADRLGVRPSEAGRSAALSAAGLSDATVSAVTGALNALAAVRYAPSPPDATARARVIERLAQALERVDREAPAPAAPAAPGARGPRPGAAVGVLLVGLAAGATVVPGAAAAQEDAPSQFATGIEHFDAGRFIEAAEAFDAHARLAPDDPAGWYNLGTAYYRAGHPGYAVWAWLRSLALDPRDPDTRNNLRVAAVPPELMARVAPPLPLRPLELALLASIAWLITGVAGGVWLARRRPRWGAVAGVAFLAAVGLGAAWLASTRSGETLIVLETVTLRAGPTLGGEPLEDLEPGSGLVPVTTYGEWLRVRTLGGTEGWIENRSAGAL